MACPPAAARTGRLVAALAMRAVTARADPSALSVLSALGAALLMTPAPAAPPLAVVIEVYRSDSYGPDLTGAAGRALYLFTDDRRGTPALPPASNCRATCAEAWPPLVAYGNVRVAARAQNHLLGFVQRRDGRPQVTYNGWPLYYHADDRAPGLPTGHGVHRFGGGWSLVTPQGTGVQRER